MKKRITIVLFFILALVILFLISCPIVNNIYAKTITDNIASVPLPENTKAVETFSQAGKLVGNGNGMQFLGAMLLQSDLSLEELERHYSAFRDSQWDYIVEVQEVQNINMIEHGTFSFKTDVSDGNFYIVYSWGSGISPFRDFDLRGH